ncbi:MAG: PAS domain S-box protein [Alphaproteobacteria bacterium]|nr:PAS domain S-box protein [Alphaproteobacteria bacterium]
MSDNVLQAPADDNELYRRMYELSAIGMFRSTPDGRYITANPAGARLHGYDSEAELLRAAPHIADEIYVDAEDRAELRRLLEERGAVVGFECQIYRHKTGERIWVRQNVCRVTDEHGRTAYLEGCVEDISDRKRNEQALAEAQNELERRVEERTAELKDSEGRFRDFVAASVDWLWEADSAHRFTYVSGNFEALTGIPIANILGRMRLETRGGGDEAVWQEHLEKLRRHEPFRDFTFPRATDSGDPTWVTVSGVPRFGDDGAFLGYRGSGRDVTAIVQAEAALHESEERFRVIAEATPTPMVINKISDGEVLYANRAADREAESRYGHPLAGTKVKAYWAEPSEHEAFLRDARKPGGVRNREIRVRHADGSIHWLLASAEEITFDGEPAIFTGFQNITAQKEVEKALAEQEAQMRLVTNNLPALITYIDADERFRFVNRTLTEWYGKNSPEIIGRTVSELHGSQYKRFKPYIERVLAGAEVTFETSVVYGDGKRRDVEVGYLPHRDAAGTVVGFFSLAIDLTGRKRDEAALRESEAKYRALVDGYAQGIFVHQHGRIVYANEKASHIYRYSREEMVDLAIGDLIPEHERERISAFRQRGAEGGLEFQGLRRDGTLVWLEGYAQNITWNGEPARQNAIVDIDDRKSAEQAQREAEEWFRAIFDQAAVGIGLMTPAGRFLAVNQKLCELMWRKEEELLDLRFEDFAHPVDYQECNEQIGRLLIGEISTFTIEIRYGPQPGTVLWGNLTVSLVREGNGDRYALLGIVEDITERKWAERALEESEDRLREATRLARLGYWVWDSIEDKCIYCSEECAQIHGLTPQEYMARASTIDGPFSLTHPDDREAYRERINTLRRGKTVEFESRILMANGEERHVREIAKPILDENGRVIQEYGTIFDITPHKMAEAALIESQERIRDFAGATSDWFWETDAEYRFTYLAGTGQGWSEKQLGQRIGRSRFEHEAFDGEPEKWRRHREDLKARRPFRDFRYKRPTPEGTVQHVRSAGRPFFDIDGHFLGYRGTTTDITVEIEARAQLTDALESMADGVVIFDAEDRLVTCNESYREAYSGIADFLIPGARFEDLIQASAERGILGTAVGREKEWIRERLDLFRRGQGLMEVQLTDGRWLQVADRKTANGYTVGIRTDITESKQRDVQLSQAQKMEALGQLTGGVAHDFNNLLAIIQGNIAFLDRKLPSDDQLKSLTAPALRAVRRGASLTQRLLAFSRQQSLEVQPVHAGELLNDLKELLQRSLGEDIAMAIDVVPDLWRCEVDPGQLEQAIVNLANNARDAMETGGRLDIEVKNQCMPDAAAAERGGMEAGDYVVISVTDDGSGMPAAVKAKVFDPFFTTKDVGKGTGLGLSMVYGFVQQSGGHVTVDSEVGRGTTFRLYLPRLMVGDAAAVAAAAGTEPPAGGELVLVVEDDDDLRAMTSLLLRDLGYRIMEAGNGEDALALLQKTDAVDLLLTDVVLTGGMSGPDIVDAAQQNHPQLKAAYMSGYLGETLNRRSGMGEGAILIRKPFDSDDLARQLREALDGG